ncbi:hypothetical protein SAMN04488522_105487 [Pedobacter caeni]|uniref:Uncharacterized protein n=1 Tax=Pedobacter caeni TaxID=288992 RepID=A0A1M5JSM0_9SPHI|nr:hypothetical protein SAMN04488522_105487 [Pedobacter caeni]
MINIEALKIILLDSDIMAFSKALSDFNIEEQGNFGNTILHYYIKHAEGLVI